MSLTKTERDALLFTSEVLVQIRLLARQPANAVALKTINEFADALHNVPQLIGEGRSEQMAWLINSGIEQALAVWRTACPGQPPTSYELNK
jgi:hypothetical protein